MTDLLSAFITYAASGPQEFCLAMALPGFFVMVFGKKIEPAKPAPKRQTKTKKRKPKNKTNTAHKKSRGKNKKVVGETPKQWAKVPEYSAESLERINNYHSRRDGHKPETDGWQNVGGRVPL